MRFRHWIVFLFLALSTVMILLQGGVPSPAAAQTWDTTWVDVRAKSIIEIFGFSLMDTVNVFGPWRMRSFEPFPLEKETEVDTVDLWNPTGRRVKEHPVFHSIGRAYLPEHDPWIESFFDVFFEIEIPELPGEILTTDMPVHMEGMANGWPPYFDRFATPEGMPPVPIFRDGIHAGFIHYWEQEMIPHYEPEAHIIVPTAYGSWVAEVEDGLVRVSAGLSGDYEATEAVFSSRMCGDPGPFTVFYVDMDGSEPAYSTINPKGSGDGWCGYFDPGSEPFEGQCVQFEVGFNVPPFGWFMDTVDVWVDKIPPIPVFQDIPRDSIANFHIDSFFDITYRLDDELIAPGFSELLMFPLQVDFERALTAVDQLGLGTPLDSVSCGPAAGASCLKYFADKGYPGLDNPGGDEAKPEQSPEDIARELQGAMGTDTSGTTANGMVAGIGSYLQGHGQSGWSVGYHPVDDATDLAEMFREFQSDSEDVIVLLEDTTADGDTTGHFVTLGSTHTTYFETIDPPSSVGTPETGIDFMDPWGGGTQADNNYPLDTSGGGQPSTEGYDLNGEGGDSKVVGYVKVSPPEAAPGSPAPAPRDLLKAASRAPWIPVATGQVTGNGAVDVLQFNTAPLPGGLYLMEIVTTDDQGFRCRDIRLAGIPAYVVGDDEPGPGMKTMLRGSYPNPFNPATTIEFSLASDAKVTLVIFDVAGRRVRTLIPGVMTDAGIHKVDWDGRNENGKQLASGVYFARFLAEGQVSARKLILLR